MIIYNTNDTQFLSVTPKDDSTRLREIMGNDIVTLNFALPEYHAFPVGCYIMYDGTKYTMQRKAKVKKIHSRNYEYTLELYAPDYVMQVRKFRNVVINYSTYAIGGDHRLSFPLTATPKEHLQMVVDNLNKEAIERNGSQATGLWTIGNCIDWDGTTDNGTETLVSYDNCYCIDALKLQADTFKTEYYFDNVNRTVSLEKLEVAKNNPLIMSYGHDKGFFSGVGFDNAESKPPVGRLFVMGGERNIDSSTYGKYKYSYDATLNLSSAIQISEKTSKTLLLPYRGELYYDGDTMYDSLLSVPTTAKDVRHYIVSADRLSIVRAGNMTYDTDNHQWVESEVNAHYNSSTGRWEEADNLVEDSCDCTEIYPKYVGTVNHVEVVSSSDNFVDIYDLNLLGFTGSAGNADIISHMGIGGEGVTVVFQSGMLSGREFDLGGHTDGTIVCEWDSVNGFKLEVVPAEIDGIVMPGDNAEYRVLTEEPSDWSTASWRYYYYVGGKTYVPVTGSPAFVSGIFYSYSLNTDYMPEVGDKFVVFGIQMPWTYYDDDNHGGAEWEMFKTAVKYLYENEVESYVFSGDMDSLWAQRHWSSSYQQSDGSVLLNGIGEYINLGWYVKFLDDLMPNGLLLRITSVKENINNPYKRNITLSNALVESTFRTKFLGLRGQLPMINNSTDKIRNVGYNRNSSTLKEVNTVIRSVNAISDRANDDRILFLSLKSAVDDFNVAINEFKGSSPSRTSFADLPTLDYSDCIDPVTGDIVIVSGQPLPGQCKIIPAVTHIDEI